jgi:hypothetical protein
MRRFYLKKRRLNDMFFVASTLGKREETHFLFDKGLKTADRVLEKIQEVIAGGLSGQPPGLL